MNTYTERLRALLSPEEKNIFQKLNTAGKVQDFLDTLPINFDETHHSPRLLLRTGKAQCIEGALFAVAAFAYHGKPPLLLDLRTVRRDDDHVVALFQYKGRWGAVSKTNHAVLRFRDPVYKDVRELALSYFHEYAFEKGGQKTLREYSDACDLRRYPPERWLIAEENLWWLADDLDAAPHHDILPHGMRPRELRPLSPLERQAIAIAQWEYPRKKR